MTEISCEDYEVIQKRCKAGDALAEKGKYKDAIQEYNAAFKLIPEPKYEYEAATWVLAAIGNSCFFGDFLKSALEAFEYAIHCPGGLGNPFIHLRLGQLEYGRGNMTKAADELARAYMGAGKEIFKNEDPKYFEFLKTQIEPPASAEW